MVAASADREWMAGYEAARSRCLSLGVEVARRHRPPSPSSVFEAGYDWGLWDHEDANGLPHAREQGA